MQHATVEQSRNYNLRRREWRPALGDLVLLRQHHLSKAVEGFAAKLAPRVASLTDLKTYHEGQLEDPEETVETTGTDVPPCTE
ncbi:hypothetical protein ACLKA6_002291 [Drosophila palustris]